MNDVKSKIIFMRAFASICRQTKKERSDRSGGEWDYHLWLGILPIAIRQQFIQRHKKERETSRLCQPVNKFSRQLSHFYPWLCEHNTNGFVYICLFIQFIVVRVSTDSWLALWVVVLFRQKLNVRHWAWVYFWLRIVNKHNHLRFICAIAFIPNGIKSSAR